MKKTLILGASANPERYAYKAAHDLVENGHQIVQVGIKSGVLAGVEINTSKDIQQNIDTITLYIGIKNQPEWYNYIIETKPKRLIFNPGTENLELANLAQKNGIEVEEACTLVLLKTKQY